MSTFSSAELRAYEVNYDAGLHAFLDRLEANLSLFHPGQVWQRLIALDDLDARFGGLDSEYSTTCMASRIHQRAKALRGRLEAVNAKLYHSVRCDIVRGGQARALLQWLQESATSRAGLSFDCDDELLSGVLQLREPSEPSVQLSPEMVFYQPTPVRHILSLMTAVAEDDVFVDLGSGLGHVPILVSMLAGARSLGIEVQGAYAASARECAHSLHLSRVRFVPQDVREADLSSGTVFYLYSPFTGSILADVLRTLRMESGRRPIKICSLGPCTRTIANEQWLKASAPPETERITVFHSQSAHNRFNH